MKDIKSYYYKSHTEGFIASSWKKDGKEEITISFINNYFCNFHIRGNKNTIKFDRNKERIVVTKK